MHGAHNPKLLNPICLNCDHRWSKHFVNDADPRCSLREHPTEDGVYQSCSCTRFRHGCLNCNHAMEFHRPSAFGFPGPCRKLSLAGEVCECEEYERST